MVLVRAELEAGGAAGVVLGLLPGAAAGLREE